MLIIPTAAVASQTLEVQPGAQLLGLAFAQKTTGLYADINLGGAPILRGILCRDRVRLIQGAYFGVGGDLMWADQQGVADPSWEGLGGRFLLYWLAPEEIPA